MIVDKAGDSVHWGKPWGSCPRGLRAARQFLAF